MKCEQHALQIFIKIASTVLVVWLKCDMSAFVVLAVAAFLRLVAEGFNFVSGSHNKASGMTLSSYRRHRVEIEQVL